MIAARLHGAGDVRIDDEPVAECLAPGWSLVAVRSVGLCGSDLHWFNEGGIGGTGISIPVVPGHEISGVALTGPFEGRRVAVDPAIPCERCETCRSGHQNLCPEVAFAGHGEVDGGMREMMCWPDNLLFALPDSLDDDAGALLEPLGVAIHAVALAHVHLGDDVLVVGAGPIGLLALQVARLAGAARVFVAEPLPHRRTAAEHFGADAAWDPGASAEEVVRRTGGRGVDAVIEVAGTDEAVRVAVDACRPGARVVLAGIPASERTAFPAGPARRKGLSLMMARRMNRTYPRAIALAQAGVRLDGLVTHRVPLVAAAEAFATASTRQGLKTVVAVG